MRYMFGHGTSKLRVSGPTTLSSDKLYDSLVVFSKLGDSKESYSSSLERVVGVQL